MGLSNSGWTACTNGTCRCTGRALAAIRDNPSDLNHLPLDHAPRLLRSQGPSPVPAGGAARLRGVLGSLYMGFWAGRVFKCKRRQEHA